MKKAIASVALILTMISAGKIDLYPEAAKVVDITDDVVTVETFTGNQFQFDGAEDWECDDIISMIMWGNNTKEVTDDEIVRVKYSGYLN